MGLKFRLSDKSRARALTHSVSPVWSVLLLCPFSPGPRVLWLALAPKRAMRDARLQRGVLGGQDQNPGSLLLVPGLDAVDSAASPCSAGLLGSRTGSRRAGESSVHRTADERAKGAKGPPSCISRPSWVMFAEIKPPSNGRKFRVKPPQSICPVPLGKVGR